MDKEKKKLAVFKFTSCDGCQLSLLDCEDELLDVLGAVEISYFMEASSSFSPGPYDLTLVEGSVTTPEEKERILDIRRQSRFLVSIGACATAGGIQALRNFANIKDFLSIVYASPEYIKTLDRSLPISAFVKVDFELQGCPINKHQLLELINSYLNGRKANIPHYSVCLECKRAGNPCVMVAHQTPCLGPVTHAGCGALCPSFNRGCYGCYGPQEDPNVPSLAQWFSQRGMKDLDLERAFRTFYPIAKAFQGGEDK